MTNPAQDARRFLWALGIGLILGLYYGFLRPLRPKHPYISDWLFLPAVFMGWLYLGFGVCHGDLRIGYCLGLLVGAFGWEITIGKLLRPLFQQWWHLISIILQGILNIFRKFFEKIHKFSKILFAIWKKSYTIEGTTRHFWRRKNGGASNGKKEQLF